MSMRVYLQLLPVIGLLCACSTAPVRNDDLQTEERHDDDVTVLGQPVDLEHVGSDERDRMLCQFNDELDVRWAEWVTDGMQLGPLFRSAEEMDAAGVSCESDIGWGEHDLLVVELVARCCRFELIGAGAVDGELVVTVIQHNDCCGIEMYGLHREIYRIPTGFSSARLDLHYTGTDCGPVP